MQTGPILRALCIALAMFIQLGSVQAFDDTALLAAEREATGMRSDIERVQSVLTQEGVSDDQLAEQRGIVEQLRINALAEVEKIVPPLEDVKQQLQQLGPVPTSGPKESEAIATQRASLSDAAARFTEAKTQFELLGLEAEQMSSKVSNQQRTLFFQRIFKPDKSILNPQLWRDTATGVWLFGTRLSSLVSAWWQEQTPKLQWPGLFLLPAALIFFWALIRLLNSYVGGWLPPKTEVPLLVSPLRRLWRVVFGAFCLIMAITIFAVLLAKPIFIRLVLISSYHRSLAY
jgi:potassium-dependent mechanosensitive channel